MTEMFHACYDEAEDESFARALKLTLDALHTALHDSLHLSEVEINTIIDAFITAIADNFRQIFIENKHLNIVA